MFTGLIEQVGSIVRVEPVAGGRRLCVEAGKIVDGIAPGASVCVNGVCLTVTSLGDRELRFDVITETLDRSNLGRLGVGDRVNLERSLRPDSRLEGHFVQGHIDGTALIRERRVSPREHVIAFVPPAELMVYIVPKGSVAIDGISLTIAAVETDGFRVALIPTTIAETTLPLKEIGDEVNIETDILTRSVVHWLERTGGRSGANPLTLSKLQEHGFA